MVGEHRSSLATRIHPGVSTLLDSEPDVWTATNIPAVSEAGVPAHDNSDA